MISNLSLDTKADDDRSLLAHQPLLMVTAGSDEEWYVFDLSIDLLQLIAEELPSEGDLNAFARLGRDLYHVVNLILYHRNIKINGSSAVIKSKRKCRSPG